MSFQIATAWTEESEEELKKMGFEKREVYMKASPNGSTNEGISEFFSMHSKPLQFATTPFWGASNKY